MKKNYKARAFILQNHPDMTTRQMAEALGIGKARVSILCTELGVKALREDALKIRLIGKAKGTKTAVELAKMLGICREHAYKICRTHALPLKRRNRVVKSADPPASTVRPPSVYSNVTREQLINRVLSA